MQVHIRKFSAVLFTGSLMTLSLTACSSGSSSSEAATSTSKTISSTTTPSAPASSSSTSAHSSSATQPTSGTTHSSSATTQPPMSTETSTHSNSAPSSSSSTIRSTTAPSPTHLSQHSVKTSPPTVAPPAANDMSHNCGSVGKDLYVFASPAYCHISTAIAQGWVSSGFKSDFHVPTTVTIPGTEAEKTTAECQVAADGLQCQFDGTGQSLRVASSANPFEGVR